jgi:Anp1
VLAEGYKEYDTGRTYLAKMGDWRNNKDEEVDLDGIGGVNILVKADVHRSGVNFPCYAFENQAETEGFAKMAKRAGYSVTGLPNYVVWHIDTEEKPGNL